MMEAVSSSETSVNIYQTTRSNNQKTVIMRGSVSETSCLVRSVSASLTCAVSNSIVLDFSSSHGGEYEVQICLQGCTAV
jgi:hypothetical protein